MLARKRAVFMAGTNDEPMVISLTTVPIATYPDSLSTIECISLPSQE